MERLLYKEGRKGSVGLGPRQRRRRHLIIHPATLERSLFPALARNDYVYLNSGASGPCSYRVLEAMRETEEFLGGPAYLEGSGLFARQGEVRSRAREAAARLVGAFPDDVALTQNTTHGMNLGAASLAWGPGDEVLSTTTEHPGCLLPLLNLGRRFGVRINLVPPPVTAGGVAAAMTPRTRLVALSHVDWTSGEALPLREICEVARERGALTLVDGAQSVGNIPVDVLATGADMYAFTAHKWVLGPEGIGALYVRPDLEGAPYSANVGYHSLKDPAAFDAGDYELREGARRFEASTTSGALAAGFAAAGGTALERGGAWHEGIRNRAELLTGLLSTLPRVRVRSPRPAQSGLVSFEVEGLAPERVVERLLEEKFVLRHIPGPHACVRASAHLFVTEVEIEALAGAVEGL